MWIFYFYLWHRIATGDWCRNKSNTRKSRYTSNHGKYFLLTSYRRERDFCLQGNTCTHLTVIPDLQISQERLPNSQLRSTSCPLSFPPKGNKLQRRSTGSCVFVFFPKQKQTNIEFLQRDLVTRWLDTDTGLLLRKTSRVKDFYIIIFLQWSLKQFLRLQSATRLTFVQVSHKVKDYSRHSDYRAKCSIKCSWRLKHCGRY